MSRSVACWSIVLCSVLLANRLAAQESTSHVMLRFDEKGKLESPSDWAKAKDDLGNRKAQHIFIIAHGWRVSRGDADETVSTLAKLLREQRNGESIDVIGVRWPSLLGENDTAADKKLKEAATLIAKSLPKSESTKEHKEKLKTYLKKPTTRLFLSVALKFRLPDDEAIDRIIDNADEPENIGRALTLFTYYEMKERADAIGAVGLHACLTELQLRLPETRFHLVGHSFGCKVCLACLASDDRADKQVDSVTLLQGAVSAFCFAPKITDLILVPRGAYVEVPKRVKGCIAATHTKNDTALCIAYVAASQAAGQVGELRSKSYFLKTDAYGALGGKGIMAVPEVLKCAMCKKGEDYQLRPGLNAVNADKIIQEHSDIRREEVAWLIWATARQKP